MTNKMVYLRKATEKDVGILYEWVNDKETRQNSFDTHIITYEEHLNWFNKMMGDSEQIQYILMDNNIPCGQIRLSIMEDMAEISYSISAKYRGIGYGKEIIRLIKERVRMDYPKINKLVAKVKPSNVASLCCFEKNGFEKKYLQLEFDLI